MTPENIVALARQTLGTPYQHQARTNGLALDCAGVPVYVGQQLGFVFDDFTQYGRLPVPVEMRAALDATLNRVQKADMQLGDVVWIRFDDEPQHLAVLGDYVYGGFTLIHAHNGAGLNRVVEHRLDDEWTARIVAVWRFRGVTA